MDWRRVFLASILLLIPVIALTQNVEKAKVYEENGVKYYKVPVSEMQALIDRVNELIDESITIIARQQQRIKELEKKQCNPS